MWHILVNFSGHLTALTCLLNFIRHLCFLSMSDITNNRHFSYELTCYFIYRASCFSPVYEVPSWLTWPSPCVFPFLKTAMRAWDVLCNEGAKFLFHIALAIFKVCQHLINEQYLVFLLLCLLRLFIQVRSSSFLAHLIIPQRQQQFANSPSQNLSKLPILASFWD